MKKIIFALSLTAPLAQAATVQNCTDAGISLTELLTPAAQNSHGYANNAITTYNIDMIEPAAASAGMAVVLPDVTSELGAAKCFAITGLSDVDVMKAKSTYDTTRGLLLTIPASGPFDGERSKPETLKVRINQKNSTVTLE